MTTRQLGEVYSPPKWVAHQKHEEYTATGWWRVLLPDGSIWMETSDQEELCSKAHPKGARVQRLYERCAHQWRDEAL